MAKCLNNMSMPLKLQTIGWADVQLCMENAVEYFGDESDNSADPLYDKWRSNYTHTCHCSEHDLQMAFELGCQAAFEHGQAAQTEVNEICEEVLREYHIEIDKGTIDAFRGGVDAILDIRQG